jgi:hypothetical protein
MKLLKIQARRSFGEAQVWEQSRFRSGNHPQHFAILCNLIYLQARVCKARLIGQYRKGYEIATESKSGAN